MNEPADSRRQPRINEQLQLYWHELCGDRRFPLESEINPDALGDAWPYCYLASVSGDAFPYDYWGAQLAEAFGEAPGNATPLPFPQAPALLATFAQVARSGVPAIDENQCVDAQGRIMKYRSCVLPLGLRGRDGVAFLLGGIKWKRFA